MPKITSVVKVTVDFSEDIKYRGCPYYVACHEYQGFIFNIYNNTFELVGDDIFLLNKQAEILSNHIHLKSKNIIAFSDHECLDVNGFSIQDTIKNNEKKDIIMMMPKNRMKIVIDGKIFHCLYHSEKIENPLYYGDNFNKENFYLKQNNINFDQTCYGDIIILDDEEMQIYLNFIK